MVAYEQVVQKLNDSAVQFTMHEHAVFHTVADMEEHLPFPKEFFLKTLAFKIKNSFWVLAATRGQDRVDYRKIAAALDISRSHIIRPSPEEVQAALGFDQGGVCPIPTNENTRVLIDARVPALEKVYCGGVRNDRTLEIATSDLLRVSGAQIQPLVRDDE
jgi:prolyl-tRNA editing enzyme YbaK/EbsC (Cys-tRNA(Pro) deacylase)